MEPDADFVDSIYQAALIPELWPGVLDQLRELAGAWAAGLLAFDPLGRVRFVSTPNYEEQLTKFVEFGADYDNVRPKRTLASGHAGFLIDTEVMTEAELATDPLYREFLHPIGVRWTAGTVLPVPSSDLLVFDLARLGTQGPFARADAERLDAYRPHLARAALMAHRLGLQAARAAAEALDVVGLPAAVLTGDARVLAANAGFARLSPHVQTGGFDRLIFSHAPAGRLITAALVALSSGEAASAGSVPIPASPESPAFIAHLVPVRGLGNDIFGRASAVLVVTEVAAPQAPLTELLHGLFDLTPAEARLARALSSGNSTREFASTANLSPETVKKQLHAVFGKTGTTRQAELVRLLSGISPLRRRE